MPDSKPHAKSPSASPIDAIIERRSVIARENIARTAALDLLAEWRRGEYESVPVFAGPGPAGACALAAARHLMNFGAEAPVHILGPAERHCAAARAEAFTLRKMGSKPVEVVSPEQARACAEAADAAGVAVASMPDESASGAQAALEGALQGVLREISVRRVVVEHDLDFRTAVPDPVDAVFVPEAPPVTPERARLLDAAAIETFRIPSLALMENAGWAAAREAYLMLNNPRAARVAVYCGRGNNGGDGFVAARHLVSWGVDVQVFLAGDRSILLDDPKTDLEILEDAGVRVLDAVDEAQIAAAGQAAKGVSLIVDALLGTGLTGRVRPPLASLIEAIDASGAPVLAVDCPSGLDCGQGMPLGVCIHAKRTVAFGAAKTGFTMGRGPEFTGAVVVADISLPRMLWKA
jgi:NAD(P)H-hydrate epimerase